MQLNCCKSWGCKNFGLTASADYQPLSYHLGYPALYCAECGSYPPLIDNQLVTQLIAEKLPQQFPQTMDQCPNGCDLTTLKRPQRYGLTSAGRQRLRCRHCLKVYTPTKPATAALLHTLAEHLTQSLNATTSIQRLGITSKRYYQLLHEFALLLGRYTRQLEQQFAPKELLAMQTEGHVLAFAGGLRLWLLTSSEATSGYQLMSTHNLSELSEPDAHYQNKADNRLTTFADAPLTEALKRRYQQLMNRYHFEDLQYGPSPCWRRHYLIQPSLVTYAHFQMLRSITDSAHHLHHYLEQESCMRGAAIMGSIERIREKQAEVFYLFAHPDRQTAFLADGRAVGWWRDRWFSTPFGGYCPVTERSHYRYPFQMRDIQTNQHYFEYLDTHFPRTLKSLTPINDHLLIQRCRYNLVTQANRVAPASYLKMPVFKHLQELVQAALSDYQQAISPLSHSEIR
ncbi:hypothetical protein ABUE30_11790 [Celerinatantimonas yamalensis]|uniref:Cytoplasmic protein n=2 Tax=Celerinatantimonas yamalensis TaxID=559956 RepID=A0ABW9G8L3_9GAMM